MSRSESSSSPPALSRQSSQQTEGNNFSMLVPISHNQNHSPIAMPLSIDVNNLGRFLGIHPEVLENEKEIQDEETAKWDGEHFEQSGKPICGFFPLNGTVDNLDPRVAEVFLNGLNSRVHEVNQSFKEALLEISQEPGSWQYELQNVSVEDLQLINVRPLAIQLQNLQTENLSKLTELARKDMPQLNKHDSMAEKPKDN